MKKIENYNYFITNDGKVFNSKMKELKPRLHTGGYLRVSLCKNGKSKDFYIHRLVGISFLGKNEQYNEINHKDSDKKNNHFLNLEWCNGSQNHNHSLFSGTKTRGEDSIKSKLKEFQVLEIRASNDSTKSISMKYNVSESCIKLIKNNKKWRWLQ